MRLIMTHLCKMPCVSLYESDTDCSEGGDDNGDDDNIHYRATAYG